MHIGIGILRGWRTDRKLHVDTLILIPKWKNTCFCIQDIRTDGWTDERTDTRTETLIWCGLPALHSSRLNPFLPRGSFRGPLQYFTSDIHTLVCTQRQCCPTQPAHSKWLKMKLLHWGFQWCIVLKWSIEFDLIITFWIVVSLLMSLFASFH